MNDVQVTAKIPRELADELEAFAAQYKLSTSGAIRTLLTQTLCDEQSGIRDELKTLAEFVSLLRHEQAALTAFVAGNLPAIEASEVEGHIEKVLQFAFARHASEQESVLATPMETTP